ncbi:MAG: hypothetical protein ABMA26_13610 [Limisphaerales bacterium]
MSTPSDCGPTPTARGAAKQELKRMMESVRRVRQELKLSHG